MEVGLVGIISVGVIRLGSLGWDHDGCVGVMGWCSRGHQGLGSLGLWSSELGWGQWVWGIRFGVWATRVDLGPIGLEFGPLGLGLGPLGLEFGY